MRKFIKLTSSRIASITAALLLIGMVIWIFSEEKDKTIHEEPKTIGLSVTVIEAIPSNSRIKVYATGITVARWLTEVTTSVNGRVVEVVSGTTPGNFVRKGDLLVSLLDTYYQSEVKAAQARIADAELNLAEFLSRQQVSKKADKAKSAFGRFEPHVNAAKANLEAAKAALIAAEKQLADTQIKSPFDAVVIADSVHPGLWVNNGDTLFNIASSEFLDVKVELPNTSWQRLNGVQQRQDGIRVVTPDGRQWPATIRYLSPVMDSVTRQRSMMLQVATPFQNSSPLLADQQVKVVFEGEELSYVVSAPASVLTEDGKVWSVIDETLKLETIELLDEQPEFVLFRYHDNPELKRLLVRFPLSTLLEGQRVSISNFEAQP